MFDSVAVVESAYRLDGSIEDWLGGILEPAAPAIDRGCGAQAVLVRPPGRRSAAIVGLASKEATMEGLSAFLHCSARDVPLDEQRVLWAHLGGRLRSLSEQLEGWSGVDGFAEDTGHPFADYVTFVANEAGPVDLVMLGFATHRLRTTPSQRDRWARIGSHLSAGLRLRLRFGASEGDLGDAAVLTPDGRCLHAEGAARRRSAQEALRAHAQRIDRLRTERGRSRPDEALTLWPALVAGRWSLVDRWDSDGRRFVVARPNPPFEEDPRALTRREREATELLARGASNLEIGLELGVSESAAGTFIGKALRKLGLRRREELVDLWADGHVFRFCVDTEELVARATALPAASSEVLDRLTPAEREVASLAARGKSDREIADLRGSALRTVSNQLRAVFRKLGIASRLELAARVQDP